MARVAEALAYAHKQNVVHRDIKPANIMYEHETDTVKVTDFGIARITDSSKTKTGLVLGTPSFMSPEQLAGKKVDGRSDLYSLGVMLFQMLTGVLPFRGDSMAELMYKIANEEAADLRTVRSDLPENLANLVALSMSKRPETRYQDGNQFAADLRTALAEYGGGATGAGMATGHAQATTSVAAATGGHDKTAVLATSAVAASAQFEKTVVHQTRAAGAQDDAFQKTSVHQAPGAGRQGDTFEKTAVYQANPAAAHNDGFEKTAVYQPKGDDKPRPAPPTVPDVEI